MDPGGESPSFQHFKVPRIPGFPGFPEVFVELRTSRPVMTCEGSDYPNHVNLRQTGGVSRGIFELVLGRELRTFF